MVIAGGSVGSSTVVYWSRLRRFIGVPPLASVLDMYHCDIKDDLLTGQWMVEVDRHGVVLDGMNAKRDNTPAWPCYFTAVANIQRRVGKSRPGQLLKRRRI